MVYLTLAYDHRLVDGAYEVESATITLSDGTTINASAECRSHGAGAILWDGGMLTSNVWDANCNEFAFDLNDPIWTEKRLRKEMNDFDQYKIQY